MEFERIWHSGDTVLHYVDRIAAAMSESGIAPDAPVGVVVRNRIPHAAAILGFIAAGRPVVMIYSYQSATSIARDIEQLALPAVILDRDDWTQPVTDAVARLGSVAVVVSLTEPEVECVAAHSPSAAPQHDPTLDSTGVHILTSGTTGPPKRVTVPTSVLQHTVLSVVVGHTSSAEDPPELVFWPFGSIGICQLLAAAYVGKPMVLLEKFSVTEWVRAVKTYGVKRAGVQPTIVRMLLDSDVDRADLASLDYLMGGSGPLEPQLRQAFEQRFGVPLLWGYGATEFAGSVCAWTPDLYRQFGAGKPESSGRPLPGVQVRIVDADTGAEVSAGQRGLLEAQVEVIGPHWVRTTDVASVDDDGFITLHGRGDGAINRGGFKVLPETVRRVLLTHPAVRDAGVVGVPDPLLGSVPFAAVEVRRGMPAPAEIELKQLVREALPSYCVPVAVAVVDELPRNAAMKVRPSEVAALYRPTSN